MTCHLAEIQKAVGGNPQYALEIRCIVEQTNALKCIPIDQTTEDIFDKLMFHSFWNTNLLYHDPDSLSCSAEYAGNMFMIFAHRFMFMSFFLALVYLAIPLIADIVYVGAKIGEHMVIGSFQVVEKISIAFIQSDLNMMRMVFELIDKTIAGYFQIILQSGKSMLEVGRDFSIQISRTVRELWNHATRDSAILLVSLFLIIMTVPAISELFHSFIQRFLLQPATKRIVGA